MTWYNFEEEQAYLDRQVEFLNSLLACLAADEDFYRRREKALDKDYQVVVVS